MARININNSGKYTNNGGTTFFGLQDDGDVAKVRFLYDQEDGSDLDYYLVHQVELNGKKRYVNCLAVQEDGTLDTHKCPLCQEGNMRQEKLFLQLYNEETDEVQLWERGKTFVPKIQSLINRKKHLVAQSIEIERNGKKGSQSTSYTFYPLEVDGKTLEDFPAKSDLLEKFIIDASVKDMEDIINGTYRIGGTAAEVTRREDNRRADRGERPQRPNRGERPARGDNF